MKCVRDTGLGEHWATWNKRCKDYKKKSWKKNCPYTVRCRTCARAFYMIDIKTRHASANTRRKTYWLLCARLWYFKSEGYRDKVKWQ